MRTISDHQSNWIIKHLFAEMAKDVNDICKPLTNFGIHLFSFRRTFKDGSRINLSNDPNWLIDYYQLKLHQSSLFEYHIDHYDSGFSLWPQESSLPIFAHGRLYYNSDNGITLILKKKTYCDFFIFGADKKNKSIINMYINNLDLIKNFTEYFYHKSDILLKKASKHLISINPRTDKIDNIKNLNNTIDRSTIRQLFSNIPTTKDSTTIQNISLSQREKSCIEYTLSGLTAKEIARHLKLSHRTIEYYMENIRLKTGCRNKYEIIQLFSHPS